jgi:hypothetical protein
LVALLLLAAASGASTPSPEPIHLADLSATSTAFSKKMMRIPPEEPQIKYHQKRYYYCEASTEGGFLSAVEALS